MHYIHFYYSLYQVICVEHTNYHLICRDIFNFHWIYRTKRGRKYNLKVHDDDDNDLSSLGLTPSKSNGSIADPQEDQDAKDLLDQDNKDAKSDAGFCTGSDTGSDGVFAEDNISDTSSALVSSVIKRFVCIDCIHR